MKKVSDINNTDNMKVAGMYLKVNTVWEDDQGHWNIALDNRQGNTILVLRFDVDRWIETFN